MQMMFLVKWGGGGGGALRPAALHERELLKF